MEKSLENYAKQYFENKKYNLKTSEKAMDGMNIKRLLKLSAIIYFQCHHEN